MMTAPLPSGVTKRRSGSVHYCRERNRLVDWHNRLSVTDDPNTVENEQFTLGGRGSLYRIDLANDAAGALQGIDSALKTLASVRVDVGALQNRLDHTASNLIGLSEQTTAARSRIEDADFAAKAQL